VRRVDVGIVRPAWETQVRSDGLVYLDTETPDGEIIKYWREGPYYEFDADEVAELDQHVRTIFEMCVAAGDHLVAHPETMRKMGIPEAAFAAIARSWEDEPPSVYGRFDLRYAGRSELAEADPSLRIPKLLEFNADTPTSLLESAVIQWRWHEFTQQGSDQWNSLHEMLIGAWRRQLGLLEKRIGRKLPRAHFAYTAEEASGEDQMNTTYLADTAREAGYEVDILLTEDIGLGEDGRFYDTQRRPIEVLFKLYPWEWLVKDRFGQAVLADLSQPGGTVWIEPIYKMLWSNKGLLPVLWQLFRDDAERSRYLLPAYFADEPHDLTSYVAKPLLGREGANVRIFTEGRNIVQTPGEYGAEGFVVQEFAPLPDFAGIGGSHYPVLGTWLVDGEPAGLAIREGDGLVTDNCSFFVPHAIA
jgi:glutathionylspermidine synthase